MKHPSSLRAWPLLLVLAAAASVQAALVIGGTAYSKRFETKLLAEPSPLAAVATKIGLGLKLDILETKGAWLRVKAPTGAGWVFSGNVSETKLEEVTGTGDTVVTANRTTATAAVRGLSDVGTKYAARRNLHSAQEDMDWMLDQSDHVTPADVEKFLQDQKKGEYK
jgi:hypothetical protein